MPKVETYIPEIAALRDAVEERARMCPSTHGDFDQLSLAVGGISAITLERIWGYSTRKADNVSSRSLNVLASFAGFGSWQDFLKHLKAQKGEDSDFFLESAISADNIPEGALIRITWQPDRIVTARHLGNARFVVETSKNASLLEGDMFSCLEFRTGLPLYLEKFSRPGDPSLEGGRYAAGLSKGISSAEIL